MVIEAQPTTKAEESRSRPPLGFLFPVVAAGVALFGIGLALRLPNRTRVVGWNVAWSGFDVLLAVLILTTWWTARRGKWVAIAAAGATTSLLVVDVWFSLTMFYSLKERPGIAVWAFVVQPSFAVALWTYVLRSIETRSMATRRETGVVPESDR